MASFLDEIYLYVSGDNEVFCVWNFLVPTRSPNTSYEQLKKPSLFRVYVRDEQLPSSVGIMINHDKDPF